jgi:hypothetical protein
MVEGFESSNVKRTEKFLKENKNNFIIHAFLETTGFGNGEEPRRMLMDVRMCECIVCMKKKPIK